MVVGMTREQFDGFNRSELGWACVGPILTPLRGKQAEVKAQVYRELTPGQRALFMFHVFHEHAHRSVVEFICWTAHTLHEYSYWIGIQAALRFFGQDAMLGIMDEMKSELEKSNDRRKQSMAEVTVMTIEEDAELRRQAIRLHTAYQALVPKTLKDIGDYIRANPDQFVQFE